MKGLYVVTLFIGAALAGIGIILQVIKATPAKSIDPSILVVSVASGVVLLLLGIGRALEAKVLFEIEERNKRLEEKLDKIVKSLEE